MRSMIRRHQRVSGPPPCIGREWHCLPDGSTCTVDVPVPVTELCASGQQGSLTAVDLRLIQGEDDGCDRRSQTGGRSGAMRPLSSHPRSCWEGACGDAVAALSNHHRELHWPGRTAEPCTTWGLFKVRSHGVRKRDHEAIRCPLRHEKNLKQAPGSMLDRPPRPTQLPAVLPRCRHRVRAEALPLLRRRVRDGPAASSSRPVTSGPSYSSSSSSAPVRTHSRLRA